MKLDLKLFLSTYSNTFVQLINIIFTEKTFKKTNEEVLAHFNLTAKRIAKRKHRLPIYTEQQQSRIFCCNGKEKLIIFLQNYEHIFSLLDRMLCNFRCRNKLPKSMKKAS